MLPYPPPQPACSHHCEACDIGWADFRAESTCWICGAETGRAKKPICITSGQSYHFEARSVRNPIDDEPLHHIRR